MIFDKRSRLKYLLESSNGVHLTSYLVNSKDLLDLKRQIKETILLADEFLHPVMSSEEQDKFLEPIKNLLNDTSILSTMTGNIGLFRNQVTFSVVNVPVDLEFGCSVATSFHVKPLLRWIQADQDFLILGLMPEDVRLYQGSQDSMKLIKIFDYSDRFIPKVIAATENARPKIYVVGNRRLSEEFFKVFKGCNPLPHWISMEFDESSLNHIAESIRIQLKKDQRRDLDNAFFEYNVAKYFKIAESNIFQIAEAASHGRVKKLIVADELKIFGKIDQKSGQLSLHPFDLDHEDDDVLDDLAQIVLSKGGEVVIAPRKDMLDGRAALAILDFDHSVSANVVGTCEQVSTHNADERIFA